MRTIYQNTCQCLLCPVCLASTASSWLIETIADYLLFLLGRVTSVRCCTGDFFSSFLVATNLAFDAFTAKFFSIQSDTKSIIYDLLNLSIFSPCFSTLTFFYTFLFWTMIMQNKVVTCRTPKSKWQMQ